MYTSPVHLLEWMTQVWWAFWRQCTKRHDLVGSGKYSAHCFPVYPTLVRLFPTGVRLQVYMCRPASILLAAKISLNLVGRNVVILLAVESGKVR